MVAALVAEMKIKPYPKDPRYRVSADGRVWGPRFDTPLKTVLRSGYPTVSIGTRRYVHHLVLETFKGLPKLGQICRHLDGDPLNNNLANLEWGTQSENCDDTRRHGRTNRGERSPFAKLTEPDVTKIRERHKSGESMKALASDFGVTELTIYLITTRRTWRHIE